MNTNWQAFDNELACWRDAGRTARFWLRDDDAVTATRALDRLLSLGVPVTIASVPVGATPELAARLEGETHADVAVHGYAHKNHAPPGEKKQEIGLYRGREVMLGELAKGFALLRQLFGARLLPLLVPPWNRIDAALVADMPALGFKGLSTYGGRNVNPGPALAIIDTHVDIIDWRGTRGGRPLGQVIAEITAALAARRNFVSDEPVGILAHHLVHDAAAWKFLDELVMRISRESGAAWISCRRLLEETET